MTLQILPALLFVVIYVGCFWLNYQKEDVYNQLPVIFNLNEPEISDHKQFFERKIFFWPADNINLEKLLEWF